MTNSFRYSLLFSVIWLALLPSCSLMSHSGPQKIDFSQGSDEYELIEVTSRASFSAKPPTYGKAEMPAGSERYRYTDLVRQRDELKIVMTDLEEDSPFAGSGQGFVYGPVEVPADGLVGVPYVGEVQVLNRRLSEVSKDIEEKAQRVSKTVQVNVNRTGRLQDTANVIGEVERPGPVPLDRSGITSLDLISAAGGAEGSEHLYTYTLRRNGKDYHFDYLGFRRSPFLVQAGDLLLVSREIKSRFHVMGALGKTSTVPFPVPSPTLADAISAATGLDERLADPSGVFVFRKGHPTKVFTFNIKNPEVVILMQEFPIQSEDLVFVTEAPLARWNRLITQMLPSNSLWAGGFRALY